ncbi:LemA family protein [Ilumatobacter sp.]|jgi:LemA protein|uniref:LemA family protein n=2 Tax=Ilumatobacter sp. TaxID=1967498 RepID=UPI0037513F13
MIVIVFFLFAIAAGVGAVAYAMSYNGLVTARQKVSDAWAVVDAELERRHKLIPGLVNAIRATAAHEQRLLLDLIEADRRAAATEHSAAKRSDPEADLEAAARAVVALRVAYPALNSQRNFLELQHELAMTEDRIGAARRFHNIKVAELNRRIQAVPGNLIAGRHAIVQADYFGSDSPR